MIFIKKYINNFLSLFGYSIVRVKEVSTLEYLLTAHNYYIGRKYLNGYSISFVDYIKSNFRKSNSSLFQDLFALWVNRDVDNGYFVEFGAGNGIDFSNTLLLESEGWSGLLIEASSNFDCLRENRSASILRNAVTDKSGQEITFYEASDKNFSSLIPSPNSKKIVVNTISLVDALSLVNAPKYIHFMSIDVEGTEYQAISGMDFDKYFVKCMVIEHNNNQQLRNNIYDFLVRKKFNRIFTNETLYEDWYINVK